MFKHDVRRYRGPAGGPPAPVRREGFAQEMCTFVLGMRMLWEALFSISTWKEDVYGRRHARRSIRTVMMPLMKRHNVSYWSDDETTNHTNSQSNALWWLLQQGASVGPASNRQPPNGERFALSMGAKTTFDIIGTTERLEAFVSEIFRRTGYSTRPPLQHENSISAAELQIKDVPNCSGLVEVLDKGAHDAIFDGFAAKSMRDLETWETADRLAASTQLLPELPFDEKKEAFHWALVRMPNNDSSFPGALRVDNPTKTTSPTSVGGVPGWSSFRLFLHARTNESTLCLRKPLPHYFHIK